MFLDRAIQGDGNVNYCQVCVRAAFGAEIQTFLVYAGTGSISDGGYKLQHGTSKTDCITYDADSSTFKSEIEKLGIGAPFKFPMRM